MNRDITERIIRARMNEQLSLEEILENSIPSDVLDEGLVKDQTKKYDVGDIIMPKELYSNSSHRSVGPHRVIIMVSEKISSEKGYKYKGFLLSTTMAKSNKYSKYANNIHISDYASILSKGVPAHKEAIVRVDDIVEFSSEDLSTSGTYKGTVSPDFLKFINMCYQNYKSGRSNANIYWEK